MDAAIQAFGVVCAMGTTVAACEKALFSGSLPELSSRTTIEDRAVPVFEVADANLPSLPQSVRNFDCRNNRIAERCIDQIADQVASAMAHTAGHRVGVVVGSSTSGLAASEVAYQRIRDGRSYPPSYHFHAQHAMGSLSRFIAERLGVKGPAYTVSTACSSAAKAMLSAKGLLEANICDVVITGGVDSLCDLTVNGFAGLGQLSAQRMNPLSIHRAGLNIGEGGALFLLTREGGNLALWGGGESMDAYHMSAPLPDGSGAELAMTRALEDAQIRNEQVAYVNLHGTATKANDAMETKAVHRVTPNAKVSSSKPFFGHCLGAAGAIEAAICCISLMDDKHRLPPHVFDGAMDPEMPPLDLALQGAKLGSPHDEYGYISNSFAFGGNNCALVLGKARGGAK